MKSTSEEQSLYTRAANYLIAAIFLLVPFHGFLTVWGASLIGHYTLLRLWSAPLLLTLVAGCLAWLARSKQLQQWFTGERLFWLLAVYALVTCVWAGGGVLFGTVSPAAALLGVWLNLRFLAFFAVIWAVARHSSWLQQHWRQLILGPALVVMAFAVLQLTVLPDNFLGHFGYSASTIEPFETINNDPRYPRFASTLRGANPLGAYLVIVVGLLAARERINRKDALWHILLALSIGALLASFSRSAWLGAVAAVSVVVFACALEAQKLRKLLLISLGMLVFTGLSFTALSRNEHFQNAIFHTSDHSTVAVSSNDQRSTALLRGTRDVLAHPLGKGTGSAGPASVHNGRGDTKLAENYFLQIGQETGWIGLGLFAAINILVARRLWKLQSNHLALACLASLVGLTLVNLLSHAWADDTLGYVWWGLTGIALAGSERLSPKKL